MLDELLGATLPAGLREVVVERAEGNPFFVEELLATLIDRQLLQRENGSWRMAELPPDFAVPDTVQAVVAARVDLLDSGEKQALQAASVIGRIFWAGPVYELVHDAEPDLRVLEERDFIRSLTTMPRRFDPTTLISLGRATRSSSSSCGHMRSDGSAARPSSQSAGSS